MLEQAKDFKDESDALFGLLEPLSEPDFDTPTLFNNWTLNDILGHLHFGNLLAELSLNNEVKFQKFYAKIKTLRDSGMDTPEATANVLNGMKGYTLLTAWHEYSDVLTTQFATADPKRRVKWIGPDMSARSSITARLMETWSHGQGAFDLLGIDRNNSDRIKNIAVLGVNTFAWTFTNRGEDLPDLTPNVRLKGPSGANWEWNLRSDEEFIDGSAVEFCQVVTQTRNIGDTQLKIRGEIAAKWMNIAQCFAGPPPTPPPPGVRKKTSAIRDLRMGRYPIFDEDNKAIPE